MGATMEKPIRGYAVLETCEGTGWVVFARSAVAARRRGAETFSDGDLSSVTCRHAPWADVFAEQGDVPVSLAVQFGWRFECNGCDARIKEDGSEREDADGNLVEGPPSSKAVGTLRITV
ncbi:hypothetical protein [Methylobacterium gnaphalii]|uniref:Uncharacterized protein n=1 Tax=Methylobacterium gnaphalii TaxID=1010610 RepID=A0A512JR49_9HYPH|nr:hypothetical protein [Methylobacterium gnaphalii]GEP12448.1 hypothetical protein MGN01_42930 [Methylobacterium gnaphalii]GJD70879.1 hypothetical protein MMMDOFMJ_3833 [Methylobacterium gnaphalii]GLS51540.1 hypothetical protein GCM10007885_43980 [Methylobacterium gnaphalii]